MNTDTDRTNTNLGPEKARSIIDDLDTLDEETKFWKTPSTQRTMQGGVIYSALEWTSSIFYTIYIILISRGNVNDSALLAVVGTMLLMLRYFAYLGFTAAGSKYLSEYLARDIKVARQYAKAACKYNMFVTGFPVIAFTIWLYITQPTNEFEKIAYFSIIITIIADRLRSNISIYIMGYKREDLSALSYWIPDMAMYICAVITYILFGVVGPLLTFMIFEVIKLMTSIWAMKKCSDFPISDMFAWGESYGLFWKLFRFNFLYSLANLAFALLTSTLIITGGKLLGVLTASQLSALYTLTSLINPLFNFFNIVGPVMQGVSEAFALKNKKLMENYTLTALKFPMFLLIPYISFVMLLGREIITIFYGARWVPLGSTILIILLPGYLFGSLASKFDNIIAGVNRPEPVIIPWLSALAVSLFALLYAKNIPDLYLVDLFLEGDPMNYGVSWRFIWIVGLSSLSMIISGIIILRVCFKVLGVRVPRDFFWKPLLVAGIILAFFSVLIRLNVVNLFTAVFGEEIGDAAYIIIMALIGIFIYVTLSMLFDALTIEDARFWGKLIQRMGPLSFIYKVFKPYAKFMLNHQISWFKREPTKWITDYDKETILKDALFDVSIIPTFSSQHAKGIGESQESEHLLDGITDIRYSSENQPAFTLKVSRPQIDLYDIVIFARIDYKIVESSIIGVEKINQGEDTTFDLQFSFDPKIKNGPHDLSIVFQAFESAKDAKNKKKDTPPKPLSGFAAFVDTRFLWYHDQEYKIMLE